MSAVLNMGWKASGDEWIRKNDYLKDTRHIIDVKDKSQYEFVKDIKVIHYT